MSYPILGIKQAELLYQLLTNGELDQDHLEKLSVSAEGGNFEDDLEVDLKDAISEKMQLYEKKPLGFGGRFDSDLSVLVHQILNLEPVVAGDSGFWRWLSFTEHLHEHISFRYSSYDWNGVDPAKKWYYGLGRIHESMYGYLWLRANCAFDPGREDDPYEIVKMGNNVDLWLSHVIRVDYGSVPSMARAFIRFSAKDPGLDTPSSRSLAKEVLRRYSTMIFEIMSEEQCYEFLRDLWSKRQEWTLN